MYRTLFTFKGAKISIAWGTRQKVSTSIFITSLASSVLRSAQLLRCSPVPFPCQVIASLPDHVKKQVIEAAKRRQRMRSRAQYMPVAGNPAMYSQTQLSNFLRSRQLNEQVRNS